MNEPSQPQTEPDLMPSGAAVDDFYSGLILTRSVKEIRAKLYVELWLSTKNGPVKLTSEAQQDVFFIEHSASAQALAILADAKLAFEHRALALTSFEHKPVVGLYFATRNTCFTAKRLLAEHAICLYESDIRLSERFLMERFVYGAARFSGKPEQTAQHGLYKAYSSVQLQPVSHYQPTLNVLSLDIECSEHGELYSIGLVSSTQSCVLMIGPVPSDAPAWIVWVKDERALLRELVSTVKAIDPDIFIGWNVINFDFRLLIQRAEKHGVALTIGRDQQRISWRDMRGEVNQGYVSMAGRVVIDGIDALKTATYHFDSFSLEFVAQALLGKGKQSDDVDNRMAAITADFKHNKVKLAKYNRQDCQLVLDIFAHTELLDFLILRSQLTGLALDRFGGSVAAFINLYLPKLHRAGYISPNRPEDGGLASPGGYVMNSLPGLYQNVIVLDFKSLYPSIIRTFKIDPLGLIEGLKLAKTLAADAEQEASLKTIPGFKGAVFSRDKHFLPDIITELWQQRDQAKRNHDAARSQAIKILMNSFYGVLGSGGCPFYDTRLASSITMRGHEIMQTTASWIEAAGYTVIYGDTDSTFVWLGNDRSALQVNQIGRELAEQINTAWRKKIGQQFGCENHLEIEFETHFTRFLMPTIRGSRTGSKKRYAGIKHLESGDKLVFKGLETVRSDWTPLAKQFQHTLYEMIFADQDATAFVQQFIIDTRAGRYNDALTYRKRLRRRLDHYVKSIPPHVKAARLADQNNAANGKPLRYQHKGWINYIMTLAGPQAVEHVNSPIDYQHYIDKQIQPIAESILPFVGIDYAKITAAQLGLF